MKFLQILVLIFGLSMVGNAQIEDRKTNLKGTIFNQVGGVIPEAWISIKDSGGDQFTFQPNSNGIYRARLSPGTYSIIVKYKNSNLYETYQIKNYEIPLANEVVLDITLRAGKEFREKFKGSGNKSSFTEPKSKKRI